MPSPRARTTPARLPLLAGLAGLACLLSACARHPMPGAPGAPARHAKARARPEDMSRRPEVARENRAFIAHEFFLRGRLQELEGNDPVALSYYQIAYEYDPASRDLCFLLADRLKGAGKLDSALQVARRCLELKGEPEAEEYQTVAELYLRRGDVQKALKYYNQAVDLDADDRDLLYTLATLYESLRDIPKQAAVMEKLLPKVDYPVRLVDKQAVNYRALGKLDAVAKLYATAWEGTGNATFGEKLAGFYRDQEMFHNELEAVDKLLAADPDNLHYRAQKAQALVQADMPDSALALYAELNRQGPKEKEFMFPYASLLFEKGRYADARRIFAALEAMEPDNPVYHFYLGSIAVEARDDAAAEAELKKAIALDDKVPEFWAKLASLYIRAGREREAQDLAAKLTSQYGKNWYSWYLQGVVDNQLAKRFEDSAKAALAPDSAREALGKRAAGLRARALDQFGKALALDDKNARVLFELGVTQERLGRKDEAIQTLGRLVKQDSSDATALNYLGYMLVELNRDMDHALALIDRALALDPGNGAYLDSKGWWYYQKRDYREARKYIELALKQTPDDAAILEHYAMILEKEGEDGEAKEAWRRVLKLDPGNEAARKRIN